MVCFIIVAMISSSYVGVTPAVAQNIKIGYVDPRAILNRMPEAKAIQQRIQNLTDRKQNELAQKQQDLQTEIQTYQQKVGVISEEARQSEEDRLTKMDQEFRQLQAAAQQEIQQTQEQLMEPLLKKIEASVQDIAAQRELDLVLNITVSGYGVLDRNIIHVSPEHQTEYNITQAVIEDLEL